MYNLKNITTPLSEIFQATVDNCAQSLGTALKSANEKLFNNRFHNRLPSHETLKKASLALMFSASAGLIATVPNYAFGLISFGAAALMGKMPQNDHIKMTTSTISTINAGQYIVNNNDSGLAMTTTHAVRSALLTYIPEHAEKAQKITAILCGGAGVALVAIGASGAENCATASIPLISVVLNSYSDTLKNDRSHIARATRFITCPANAAYDLSVGNIGGVAINIAFLRNILKNAINEKDFPPAIDEKGQSLGTAKRFGIYFRSLNHEKQEWKHPEL